MQTSFLIANEIVLRRAIEAVGKLQVLEPGQRWQVVIQSEKTKRKSQRRRHGVRWTAGLGV